MIPVVINNNISVSIIRAHHTTSMQYNQSNRPPELRSSS